jgi:hypothetical protein
MKTLLAVANTMLFCAVFMTAMIKFGYAEDVLKNVVKEVVQEELKERFNDKLPQLENATTRISAADTITARNVGHVPARAHM